MTYLDSVSDWQLDAACSPEDQDRFFPTGRPRNDAKALCAGCPVQQECLDAALESPWQPWGTWGGKAAAELIPMWRARNPQPADRLNLLGLS